MNQKRQKGTLHRLLFMPDTPNPLHTIFSEPNLSEDHLLLIFSLYHCLQGKITYQVAVPSFSFVFVGVPKSSEKEIQVLVKL